MWEGSERSFGSGGQDSGSYASLRSGFRQLAQYDEVTVALVRMGHPLQTLWPFQAVIANVTAVYVHFIGLPISLCSLQPLITGRDIGRRVRGEERGRGSTDLLASQL